MATTNIRGTQIVDASVDLTVDVTNTLPVGNGGTGNATNTLNNLLIGNGTGALLSIAPGTSGNVLTSNGTAWASTAAGGGATPQKPTAGFTIAANTQVMFFTNIDMTAANGDLTVNGILQGVH